MLSGDRRFALRVLTLNLWAMGGSWTDRRQVIAEGIQTLDPDLMAFQEAVKDADHDTVAELISPTYHVVHQHRGLVGDRNGVAIASRWPIRAVHELDQQLGPQTSDFSASTMLAEIEAPESWGELLFVNHTPSWKPALEFERERQTIAAARFIEEFVAPRSMHVVLAGDLDATPDAASIRFLQGLQSLDATSVCYRDAWDWMHPDDPGHTFTLRNPLMMEDSDIRQELSRRIDYIFVRCDDRGPTLPIIDCRLAFDQPVDGIWASDHFGVVADLEWKGLE